MHFKILLILAILYLSIAAIAFGAGWVKYRETQRLKGLLKGSFETFEPQSFIKAHEPRAKSLNQGINPDQLDEQKRLERLKRLSQYIR